MMRYTTFFSSTLAVLFLFSSVSIASIEFQHCQTTSMDGRCTWTPMSSEFRKPIESVLAQLSEDFSGLIGKISKVQIVDKFSGTASIGPNDPTKPTIDGYTLVLSKRALDYRDDASSFLTWKESQFLTGVTATELPTIVLSIPAVRHPALYYIILHELGHVAWYEYGVDQVTCIHPVMESKPYWDAAFYLESYLSKNPNENYKSLNCHYTDNSFLAQSWKTKWEFDQKNRLIVSRIESYDFAELNKICFYGCDQPAKWTPEEILKLYTSLYAETPFTTVYSAYFKPEEDFAESFAILHLSRLPNAEYSIKLTRGQKFDIFKKVHSQFFQGKRWLLNSYLGLALKH